jgi:hypothetical protein
MKTLNRPTALIVAAIGLMIGAIGPWVTVLGIISAGPSNFTEVALVVFGGIGLVVCSAISGRYMRPVSILVGVLILVEIVNVWFRLGEGNTNDLVNPGWGLFLSTFAALFLIASTFVAKQKVATVR